MSFDKTIRSALETATQALEDAIQGAVHVMVEHESADARDRLQVRATVDGAGLSSLRISNCWGSVGVTGHDGSEVTVEARVASAHANPETLQRRVEEGVRRVGSVLEVTPPSGLRARVDYVVSVPNALQVSISANHGPVSAKGLGGSLDIESDNGEVRVEGARGEVSVRSTNGAVDAKDLSSRAELKSKNGAITVAGARGALEAKTVNGAVSVSEASSSLTLRTVQGRIHYRGQVHGDFDFATTHGAIALEVPPGQLFELDADVRVGDVRIALPFSDGAEGPRDSGEALPAVHLRCDVGDITIEELLH